MYQKGHKHSEEVKQKQRLSKLGEKNPMFGKKLSAETRAKMSASRTGMKRPRSSEMIEKHRQSLLKFYGTKEGKELRKKLSELMDGTSLHKGYRHTFSDEFKIKRSQFMKDVWARGEEYKSKRVYNILLASNIRPTKPEIAVGCILTELQPKDWEYVGDGQWIICGRNPDFVNVNGKKSVVLVHGVYWHLWKKQEGNPELTREGVERDDINFYKTYGWDCLVVWEDELKHPALVREKIREFVNK